MDEFPGERPDKEVRAGLRPREGYLHMNEYSHLRWQCRRGLKELDVLLEDYLTNHFANAESEEQRAFAALLDLPDPILLAYIMDREQPATPEQRRVISRLRRTPGN